MHDPRSAFPALAERGVKLITRLDDLSIDDRRHLDQYFNTQCLPGAHAARRRSGPPLPLHQQPVALVGSCAARRQRRRAVRPGQGAQDPSPVGSLAAVPTGTHRSSWSSPPTWRRSSPASRSWAPFRSGSAATPISKSMPARRTICSKLIQEEVRNRRFAEVVRLEVDPGMPVSLRQLVLAELNADQESDGLPLTEEDIYETVGLLDASDLMTIAGLEIADLHDPTFIPVVPIPTGRESEHLRCGARRRRPGASSVRELCRQRRAVHPDGRRGPRRARDQDDAVSHRWRFPHRPAARHGRGTRENRSRC